MHFKNISKFTFFYKFEIILILFSFFLSCLKVFWGASKNSSEVCYSTAHSLADTYISATSREILSLAEIISLNTFSLSQIIIKSFSSLENSDCISLYFLRFLAYFFPLIALSILCARVIKFKDRRFFIISIPTLFFLNYIYNFKYFLPIDFLDFNYSFLMGAVNTTWHINGLLAQSFIFLVVTTIFFIKNKLLRWLILILGGLINPIINTLVPLGIYLSKFLINKKINSIKIMESVIPVISYFLLKYIWNLFSIKKINSIVFDSDYKENYLNFILNNDVHRNLYDNTFSQLTDKYIISLFINTFNDSQSTRLLSLITSYGAYLILIIFFALFLKFISNKIKFQKIINIELINTYFYKIISPLIIFLFSVILIDFIVKFFLMELGNNPLNISILYNQYYISRIINVLFRYIYFICFSFSSINLFNCTYIFIKKGLSSR